MSYLFIINNLPVCNLFYPIQHQLMIRCCLLSNQINEKSIFNEEEKTAHTEVYCEHSSHCQVTVKRHSRSRHANEYNETNMYGNGFWPLVAKNYFLLAAKSSAASLQFPSKYLLNTRTLSR